MTQINSAFPNMIDSAVLDSVAQSLGQIVGSLSNFGQMNLTPISTLAGLGGGLLGVPPGFNSAGPAFQATAPQNGKMSVDLGDGYTLNINKANSEIDITDSQGNVTQIWGDPHINVNGKAVGNFWGTTTFNLADGTQITINTKPFASNPSVDVANQVIITRGGQGMVIDGVSQDTSTPLTEQSANGFLIDLTTNRGLNLDERDQPGQSYGWNSDLSGQAVTQNDLNLTKPNEQGALALAEFGQQMGQAISAWLVFGDIGALAELTDMQADSGQSNSSAGGAPAAAGQPVSSLSVLLASLA